MAEEKWSKVEIYEQLFDEDEERLFGVDDMADEDVKAWIEQEEEIAYDAIGEGAEYYANKLCEINEDLITKTDNLRCQRWQP